MCLRALERFYLRFSLTWVYSCLVSFVLVSGIYMVWKMRKRNKMGWLFGNDFADAEYVGL